MVQVIQGLMDRAEEDEIAEVLHVFDFFAQHGLPKHGVLDEQWVPLAAEEGWAIVAGDRSKKKGKGKKGKMLIRLCAEYGIVSFILSPSVQRRRVFKKLLTILSVWHEIVDQGHNAVPGTRCEIEPFSHKNKYRGRGRLIVKNVPEIPKAPPGELF